MNISPKTKLMVEHYIYGIVVAGVAIYQTGNHDLKKVVWGAAVAVLGPVLKAGWDKVKK